MKRDLLRVGAVVCLGAAMVLGASGCGYMKDRGHDAINMFDLGITVNKSWKPQFAFYFDFFNVTPTGYADLDTKVLGWGNRQIGWMDYNADAWGYMAHGEESHGYGVFNPGDPQQARPDQQDLTERPAYDVGFRGAFEEDNRRPPKIQHIQCDRIFHFGWIGIQNTMRPLGILDFVVGWTGYDLLGDNEVGPPEASPAPVAAEDSDQQA